MAEVEKRGTVTPLESLFTSEEAAKAARRVEEAIADRQKELRRLRDFISDNSALIHHVQRLPDELSHDIMVPFGSAAFIPGRLIHTNEFLVLLGEGYYAERTAKQTVEILQRRGKSLEAHLESLKRIMKDLEAEAKFFDSTAAEVTEGLVEIREEYAEETQGLSNTIFMSSSKVHDSGAPDEQDADAKIMARLEELEREEEEAVSDLGEDDDDETASSSDDDEDDEYASYLKVAEDEDDEEDNDEDEYLNDNVENISEIVDAVPVSKAIGPGTFFSTSMQHNARGLQQHSSDQSSVSSSKMQVAPEASLRQIVEQTHMAQNPALPPEMREYIPKTPLDIQNSENKSSKMGSTERKAFTGTIIEHSHGLSPAKPTNDSTSGQVEVSSLSLSSQWIVTVIFAVFFISGPEKIVVLLAVIKAGLQVQDAER